MTSLKNFLSVSHESLDDVEISENTSLEHEETFSKHPYGEKSFSSHETYSKPKQFHESEIVWSTPKDKSRQFPISNQDSIKFPNLQNMKDQSSSSACKDWQNSPKMHFNKLFIKTPSREVQPLASIPMNHLHQDITEDTFNIDLHFNEDEFMQKKNGIRSKSHLGSLSMAENDFELEIDSNENIQYDRSKTPTFRLNSSSLKSIQTPKRSETPNSFSRRSQKVGINSIRNIKLDKQLSVKKLTPLDATYSRNGSTNSLNYSTRTNTPKPVLSFDFNPIIEINTTSQSQQGRQKKFIAPSTSKPHTLKREDSLNFLQNLKSNALHKVENYESNRNSIKVIDTAEYKNLPSLDQGRSNNFPNENLSLNYPAANRSKHQLFHSPTNTSDDRQNNLLGLPSISKQKDEAISQGDIPNAAHVNNQQNNRTQLDSDNSIQISPQNSLDSLSNHFLHNAKDASRAQLQSRQSSIKPLLNRTLTLPTTLQQPSSLYLPPDTYADMRTCKFRHFIFQFGEKFAPYHSDLKISLFFILKDIMQFHDIYLENNNQCELIEKFLHEYDSSFQMYSTTFYDDSSALYNAMCQIVNQLPFSFIVNILENRKKSIDDDLMNPPGRQNIHLSPGKTNGASLTVQPSKQFVKEPTNNVGSFSTYQGFDPAGNDIIIFSVLCAHAYIEPNVVIHSKHAMKFMYECLQYDDHLPSIQPMPEGSNLAGSTIAIYNLFFLLSAFHMLLLSTSDFSEEIYHKDIEYILFPKCIRILVYVCKQFKEQVDTLVSGYHLLRPILSILDTLFEENPIFQKIYLRMDQQGQYFIDLLKYNPGVHRNSQCIVSTQKLAFRILNRVMNVHHTHREFNLYSTSLNALLNTATDYLNSFALAEHESNAFSYHQSIGIMNAIWNSGDDFLCILLIFLQHILSIIYDITSSSFTFKGVSQGIELKQELINKVDPLMITHSLILIAHASRSALLTFQGELDVSPDPDEDERNSVSISEELFLSNRMQDEHSINDTSNDTNNIAEDGLVSPRDVDSSNARISHSKAILINAFICLDYLALQRIYSTLLLQLGLIRLAKKSLQQIGHSPVIIQLLFTLCQQDSYTIAKLAFDEPNFFRVLIQCAVDCFESHAESLSLLRIIDGILNGFNSHKESENIVSKFRVHEYRILRSQIIDKIRLFFIHHNPETRHITYEILHRIGCFELEMNRTIHRHLQRSDNALCKFFARSVSSNHVVTSKAILLILSTPGVDLKRWGKFDHPVFNLNKDVVGHFPACDVCGHIHSDTHPLQMCSGCKARLYCSKKCQDLHYKVHRKFCNPSRKLDFEKWVVIVKE